MVDGELADAWRVVEGTLIAVFAGDAVRELRSIEAKLASAAPGGERALLSTAAAMAAVIACRFDTAAAHAAVAADASEGCELPVRRLGCAVVLMCDAMAGTDHAVARGIDADATRALLEEPGRGRLLARYLLAEAALGSGAFEAAGVLILSAGLLPGQIVAPGDPEDGPVDGAALTLQLLAARALAFRGRGADAQAILEAFRRAGTRVPPRATTVLLAIGCYAAAQAADRERFVALADTVLDRTRNDGNYLSVGSCLYVAWGLRTAGQLQRAAALLSATAGRGLERCKIWDRALGYELLVEAALERGDRHRAAEVLGHAAGLMRYAVAASPVTRAQGVLATSAGRAVDAHELALAAIRLDEEAGASGEVLRGKLVQAAALSGSDARTAAGLYHEVASESLGAGNEAMRALAARRWRALAEEVPDLRGDGAVLTARQRQIAVLMGEGHSNPAIAQVLFLSPRTVQSHVAEILRITGARSRSQVAAAFATGTGDRDLSALSPRQREIAELIAEGRRNAEIAGILGLSEKTVENHVSALLRRLGVPSRAAVAALAGSRR
jgi:DNA-binding NarL/FixJ family response regulator